MPICPLPSPSHPRTFRLLLPLRAEADMENILPTLLLLSPVPLFFKPFPHELKITNFKFKDRERRARKKMKYSKSLVAFTCQILMNDWAKCSERETRKGEAETSKCPFSYIFKDQILFGRKLFSASPHERHERRKKFLYENVNSHVIQSIKIQNWRKDEIVKLLLCSIKLCQTIRAPKSLQRAISTQRTLMSYPFRAAST
jgi:hypothetical protein